MSALDERKRFNINGEMLKKSIACRTDWMGLGTGQYLGKILIKDIWYAIVLWKNAVMPDIVNAVVLEVSRDGISWEPFTG